MNKTNNRALNSVIGALVADSASMGFHWLNDQVAIKTLSNGTPEFHAPNKKEFADRGYFAHAGKIPGDNSQYGAQLVAMLDAIALKGSYEEQSYIQSFKEWFDFGGKWQGYIDEPTKITLLTLHEREANEQPLSQCGADNCQLPAISKLPGLVALHHSDSTLLSLAESAVRVTNNNNAAVEYGIAAAQIIRSAIEGKTPTQCVQSALNLSERVDEAINVAQELVLKPSSEVATQLGMHSSLDVAFPVTLHLLLNATSYEAAVRENILCGGDSCGRAILLGATLGACYQGGAKDIPRDWETRVTIPKSLLACHRILFDQ